MGEGLMASPTTLARQRRREAEERAREVAQNAISQEPEEAVVETIHGNLRSSAPRDLTQFYQTVYGIHMQYQKRHLDVLEMLTHDDRQWQTVRRVALDIINEEWKTLESFLHQSIAGITATDPPKETKDVRSEVQEPAG